MKASEVLVELNIELEILKGYLAHINYTFFSTDQPIPKDIHDKIEAIHGDENMKKIILAKRESEIILAYEDKDNYKFNAKVKWYYNHQTSGEYGFLELNGLPDIHFSGKSYLYNNPEFLKPGDEVVVTLSKKDVDTKKSNIKAISVNDLSDEKDIHFLLFYLLNHFQSLFSKQVEVLINRISILSVDLTDEDKTGIKLFIEDKIKTERLEIDKIKYFYVILKACKIDLTDFNNYITTLSPFKKFQLWKYSEDLEIEFKYIQEPLTTYVKTALGNVLSSNNKGRFSIKNENNSMIEKAMLFLKRIIVIHQKEILDELLEEVCNSYVDNKYEYLILLIETYLSLNISINFEQFATKLSDSVLYNIWLKKESIVIKFELIKNTIFKEIKKTSLQNNIKLLDRLATESQKEILDHLFTETCLVNDNSEYDYLVSIIKIYNQFGIVVNYQNTSNEQHLKLWENNFITEFPFDLVFNKLMSLKNEYYNFKPQITHPIVENSLYFERLKEPDLKNILARTLYENEVVNNQKAFKTVLFFIKHIPEQYKAEYLNSILKNASDYYKLQLFVLDYTDEVDYNEVVIYTGLLSSASQKLFFKKIIKLIAENKIDIDLEDLNRITTIDYQTSEYAKEIDGVGLDFTLSVILKVINDLKNQVSTSRTSIFDLVANQIKNPKDLLVIDGFFEKCSGKTIIEEIITKKLEDGTSKTIYGTTKKEHFLPRFSTFCDGRKAVVKGTTEPVLCKKSSLEFWWCENSQCYDVCRTKHTPLEWENYTLEDILQILKISYDEVQYEILLNVINRVNRFLQHLSCRKCNSILKPKGKSNYTFYGVSMFSCQNQECQEHSKDIYLSHCLNGQCEDIIDSRDSVKCKTHGYQDECGWYICKNCNACCSSEKLKARSSYLEKLGQEYKCHLEGHRDRGIICCSDCGHEMKEPIASNELYKKQLDWFIDQKDNHPNITRSGQRKNDGKWWFIWVRGKFSYEEYRKQIQGLFSSGFSIPDFNNKEKDNQLIAEPFEKKELGTDKIFVCPNCDKHFDLNNKEEFNLPRKKALQKFHFNIFPQINN